MTAGQKGYKGNVRFRGDEKIAFNGPDDGKALEPEVENAHLYVEIAQGKDKI